MKVTKKVEEVQVYDKITGFVCDKRKKSFDKEVDIWEFQERFSYTFTGGYGSVFGDMSTYSIDLCQRCFDECVGDYLQLVESGL